MNETTKKCPMCAETIKAEARLCRFCGARFEIKIKGYCTNCHEMREADENGHCVKCGSELVDKQIESTLIPQETTLTPPRPIQPALPTLQPIITPSQTLDMPPRGPYLVKVERRETYKCPAVCFVCGTPTFGQTYRIEAKDKTDLIVVEITQKRSLELPICAECAKLPQKQTAANRWGCLAAVLLAGIPIIMLFSQSPPYVIVLLILVGVLVFFSTRYLISQGEAPEIREHLKYLKATKFVGFGAPIEIVLPNYTFATLFCELNGGELTQWKLF